MAYQDTKEAMSNLERLAETPTSTPKSARFCFLAACVFGFTGVTFGAFGAHALKDKLKPEYYEAFETGDADSHRPYFPSLKLTLVGVRYQFYHVVPLFACAALSLMSADEVHSYVICSKLI